MHTGKAELPCRFALDKEKTEVTPHYPDDADVLEMWKRKSGHEVGGGSQKPKFYGDNTMRAGTTTAGVSGGG